MTRTHLDTIRKIVKTHRWAVQATLSDPPGRTVAYTVGLTALGHPELVIAGLPSEACMKLLNRVADRLVDGLLVLDEGVRVEGVVSSGQVQLRRIDPDLAHRVLGVAEDLYGSVHAWQVVLPDGRGLFEGEDGFDERFVGRQRLLQPEDLS